MQQAIKHLVLIFSIKNVAVYAQLINKIILL